MTSASSKRVNANRLKFIIGGALFFTAVVFMIISATRATAEFFLTVREVQESSRDLAGQNLRVSGAVLGDSIGFDADSGILTFTIAHIPGDEKEIDALGGISAVLHQAVNDPDRPRLEVRYRGAAPDMLKDEAQAILTGTLNGEGVFIAEELLLKCPTKYEEALPDQVE